ncbi:gamma-glutamyltransferase [Govanella unica]|uniref:Glutathione hydrolase proenzyme n=1 Tax=Govanella unica TaxID=2975056 RepID=A0A9X3TWZ9_9PROT|nr:gamma-glutamyltransferase [Govania unica]MDA5192937.1 gamma-glutamyltransferase [Govania unica]
MKKHWGIAAVCLLFWSVSVPPLAALERPAVTAKSQMVVAANPYAADAGREILRAGGNAIDAAIAVQLVLSLVEPQSSGIGGGAFMVYYAPATTDHPAVLTSYDGRETAPQAVTPELFAAIPKTRDGFLDAVAGGRSVGTPGVLAMLAMAHGEHGKLPWNKLFGPALKLAEDGFVISPRLQFLAESDPLLRKFPAARDYLFTPDGKARAAGSLLRNPAYAQVLKQLRDQGVRAFYEGPLAKDIVAAVQGAALNPGALALEDLKNYTPKERAVICGPYRLMKVCGMGPPSSGGTTVLGILGVLDHFDLAQYGPNSVEAAHLFAEASRLAYADRNRYIGDPDKVSVPVAGLIDAGYLKSRAALVNPARSMGIAAPGTPPGAPVAAESFTPELPATSHFSIIDNTGAAVSMTTSVESAFGSRLFVAGFFLNNELTDFAFEPTMDGKPVANRVEPGKRPRSAMSPTLVFDDKDQLRIDMGSPGGPAIIAYVARALTGLIDWKLPVNAAVALPHVINQNGVTTLEEDTPVAADAAALRALGHEVALRRISSGLNGFVIEGDGENRRIIGAGDPRREGIALGD